jgi:hypothetical protein
MIPWYERVPPWLVLLIGVPVTIFGLLIGATPGVFAGIFTAIAWFYARGNRLDRLRRY